MVDKGGSESRPFLSVLICTYGEDGIRRVAEAGYPVVEGVEYCVSWQLPEDDPVIPEELDRPDVRIEVSRTRGLSLNRNLSLLMARGRLSLISDDDVRYVPEYFANIRKAFESNPEADIITFSYESAHYPKSFPDHSFDHRDAPKGYFVTSFEIAFRTDRVAGHIFFDERFGIGALWPSDEESLFLDSARKHGLKLIFVPLDAARHDGSTTSDREGKKPLFIETKGAAFRLLFPYTWPLRMLTHLLHRPGGMSVSQFIGSWMKGACGISHHRCKCKARIPDKASR